MSEPPEMHFDAPYAEQFPARRLSAHAAKEFLNSKCYHNRIFSPQEVYDDFHSAEGFLLARWIAVSQGRHIAPLAKRTVLSDVAASILVPILEEMAGWDVARIRTFFEEVDLLIQPWDGVRADWLTITSHPTSAKARLGR